MSVIGFYRISIWLPVILPVAARLMWSGLVAVGIPTGPVDDVLKFLAATGVYSIPYIPFALVATWLIRRKDESYIRRLIFVLPIVMTVTAIAACLIVGAISGRMRLWIEVAEFAVTVILLVGYSYVLLTVLLRTFAVRSGG